LILSLYLINKRELKLFENYGKTIKTLKILETIFLFEMVFFCKKT